MPELLTFLALVAFVLVLAGLSEGFVSRAPLSFPMIFLGLGVVLGYRGVISLSPHSPMLEAVAVVTLSLVLFLDAVRRPFPRVSSRPRRTGTAAGRATKLVRAARARLAPARAPRRAGQHGGG